MTVTTELSRASFVWTGVETSFACGFPADQAADLTVSIFTAAGGEIPLTRGIHFNVTLETVTNLVTITPIVFPVSSGTLIAARATPALVNEVLKDGQDFSLDVIQKLHDRAAMRSAEDRTQFSRSILAPPNEDGFVLPSIAERANRWLAFTPAGGAVALPAPSVIVGSGIADFQSSLAAAGVTLPIIQLFFRTAGYFAPGDLGGGLYKVVGAEPAHAGKIQLGGSLWGELVEERPRPQQFGAIPHATNDLTTALQNWIGYIEAGFDEVNVVGSRTGYAPAGMYRATTLTFAKPITIDGDGPTSTLFKQFAGHPDSMFKVRCVYDNYHYYNQQTLPPTVAIKNLRIMGGDQLAALPNQHGLDLQEAPSKHLVTRVLLFNVSIQRFAGHNLHALAWRGYVHGIAGETHNAGTDGIHLNSINDFRFSHWNSYVNGRYGRLLSGCGFTIWEASNTWSNQGGGNYIFNGVATQKVNHTFLGGTIDRNKGHGFTVDIRGAQQAVHFIGLEFLYNSASADNSNDNTFDDIALTNTCVGTVYCSAVKMGRTFSQQVEPGEVTRYHVGYQGSGGMVVFDSTCVFEGGALIENTARATAIWHSAIVSKRNISSETQMSIGTPTSAAARRLLIQALAQQRSVSFIDGTILRLELGVSAINDFFINQHNASAVYERTPFSIRASDGRVRLGTPTLFVSYTVATLPSAASFGAGCDIYVSDGASNKHKGISDGTNWRFPDGNIVS